MERILFEKIKGVKMAFDNKNLSVIAYANDWTLWHYRTQDKIEDVVDVGYFPERTVDLMAVGDVFYITIGGFTYQRQVINIENRKVTLGKLG